MFSVICAPTASGKTVLLEMAMIHEIMKHESKNAISNKFHVLYLAPLKAIVEEKCLEWQQRFFKFKVNCFSLTGDTEFEDYKASRSTNFAKVNILLATPEKFDYMIRNNSESRELLRLFQLVMIDEVHMLGDKLRGDKLEATITRIKAIRDKVNDAFTSENYSDYAKSDCLSKRSNHLRFIAISATAPNVEDIAAWLDIKNGYGIRLSPELRPVKLKKFVFGVEPIKSAASSEYRFDIQLSYKLERYIREYSSAKPTLVFCSTRKSVEFTAKILASSHLSFFANHSQRSKYFYELSRLAESQLDMNNGSTEFNFKNAELKLTLATGVGFYHSGLDHGDRRLLEKLFAQSLVPVLVSTSSLAMGVNLPAHLVVIKNTVQYNAGYTTEYDISQILQMIGLFLSPHYFKQFIQLCIYQVELGDNIWMKILWPSF